jgi:hypothetical protein
VPLSDPKEINVAQQPLGLPTPTPTAIRTPPNRAIQAQSPDASEAASSPFGSQPLNRAGSFTQPLPGIADKLSQASPASQTVRSPGSTAGGDIESAPQFNRPNNPSQGWQPIRSANPSGSLTATEQASAGTTTSQRPLNGGSLPAKPAQPGDFGTGALPKPDPIDRGQLPPPGTPIVVPRIITPQTSQAETPSSSSNPQLPAANRAVQIQSNANVSPTSDAAGPSVPTSANLPANRPSQTWQSAVPNNNQRQASTVDHQQEPSASAQTTIKDDGD